MSAGKMLLGIFAGAAAGAALGILFAPDKGTETRRKIAEKSDEYAGQVKDKFNGIVDNLSKKMDDMQSKANDVANRAKSNVEEMKHTSN